MRVRPAGSFSRRKPSPLWNTIGGVDESTSSTKPGRGARLLEAIRNPAGREGSTRDGQSLRLVPRRRSATVFYGRLGGPASSLGRSARLREIVPLLLVAHVERDLD